MSEEKFQKLLKKYSIPENKSVDEMIELLEGRLECLGWGPLT